MRKYQLKHCFNVKYSINNAGNDQIHVIIYRPELVSLVKTV